MEDIYINMLLDTAKNKNVSLVKLCEGIYTGEMLYMVKTGSKTIDRVIIKRLMSRIGIDTGDYVSFLEYPEYDMWFMRLQIINDIEDEKLEEAEKKLEQYTENCQHIKNKSSIRLEKQFVMFMKLQIMEHKKDETYVQVAIDMYREAIKLTVPNIDEKEISELCLSPAEFVMVVQYRYLCYKSDDIDEIANKYEQLFDYIEQSTYGKVARAKVYSKVVLCMYREFCQLQNNSILQMSGAKDKIITERMEQFQKKIYKHSEMAIELLSERHFLYYMTEMLEISIEMLNKILLNLKDTSDAEQKRELLSKRKTQLKVLTELYEQYKVNPYMSDASYIYRESGVYCISEVLKARREMFGMSYDELCDGICEKRTVIRSEKKKSKLQRAIYKQLFSKLNLYPDYINMGIVTRSKEEMEMYEELRFASNSFRYEKARELINILKAVLPKHPINMQMLERQDSYNRWHCKDITGEEHIANLKRALNYTIDIDKIYKSEKDIFITTSELSTFYQISITYKKMKNLNEAWEYIEVLLNYCKKMYNQGLATGRMGIYGLVMTYIASLMGDMGKYDESNKISKTYIHMALKTRRNELVHHNMYNLGWNENEEKKAVDVYNDAMRRSAVVCQLTNDKNDELFYLGEIIPAQVHHSQHVHHMS